MARPRKTSTSPGLTDTELEYLAGVFEAQDGLTRTNDISAVSIDKDEDWPKYMAKTYGGEAKSFVAKNGKTWWGWFVPLRRRFELITIIEQSGKTKGTGPYKFDGIRGRLLKAIPLDQRDGLEL